MSKKFTNVLTGSVFTEKDIDQMIIDVDEMGLGLTSWERSFIESVSEQFDRTRDISAKQLETLEKLYATKTK